MMGSAEECVYDSSLLSCFLSRRVKTERRYPGHIAKAERQLQDYLSMVDVVVEVRDCRIPAATTHQLVPTWVGKR